MSIIAVGSLAFDSITTPVGSVERILGGSLTHFSNAAHFYSKPHLVGIVGNDFGEENKKFLAQNASDLDGVVTLSDEKSFFWKGHYTENFDEAVTEITELNAFAKFDPVVPQQYLEMKDSVLFLANIHPDIQRLVSEQCQNARLKILDTMNFWITSARDSLERAFDVVDGIIINEGEAVMLSGEQNLLLAAQKLFRPNFKFLILKKGSNGVMVFGRDYMISLPAYPLTKIVDPTGAGDSFAGGFVSYLDNKGWFEPTQEQAKEAAVYATVVASFAVQGFGVQGLAEIGLEEIEARKADFRKKSGF